MKLSRTKSGHKSRQDIERETGDNQLFHADAQKSSINPGNFVDFNFPSFFPGLNMDMLFDFDKAAHEKEKNTERLVPQIGDFPIEMAESQSIHDLQLEASSPENIEKANEKIMLRDQQLGLTSQPFAPLEIYWEDITIIATIKQRKFRFLPCCQTVTTKVILDQCTGIIKPGTFTAILGPSGCGKTTLLNFLSGRMVSNNLSMTGTLKVNGTDVPNIEIVSNQVAYVMQDDILLATFTPREAFNFTATLRLNLPDEERASKVEQLLKDLGLQECANTKVGNNLIRGLSGGERKRTSIGVELLTNPSLIFLDEPTTGLDSATSFHVVNILKKLAKSGRTVISTIHQPSSEIFGTFDKLLLMVQGKIIYQGNASEAIDYFAGFGLHSPAFSNPSTFFMKCMNPEGLLVENMQKNQDFNLNLTPEIKAEFKQRVAKFLEFYRNSTNFKEITPSKELEIPKNNRKHTATWFTQFSLVAKRGLLNELRNPLDLRTRFFSTIVFSFIVCIVFYGLGDYSRGIQNREGVLFFFMMGVSFTPIMHSILTFSYERPLFLREILNKTYCVSAYFWGKTSCEFPFHLVYPVIQVLIMYYIIGLSLTSEDKPFVLMLIGMCTFFCGVSFGLFFSVILSEEMAMSLVPLITIPFMLFGGFFVNQNNIPYYFYPFEYLSPIKYGYQAVIENEFRDTVYYCDATEKTICDPVKDANFQQNIGESCLILIGLGIALRFLAFFTMKAVSTPKRPELRAK